MKVGVKQPSDKKNIAPAYNIRKSKRKKIIKQTESNEKKEPKKKSFDFCRRLMHNVKIVYFPHSHGYVFEYLCL